MLALSLRREKHMNDIIETLLDRAQDSGYDADTPEAVFAPYLTFTTREGYLEWRTAWRARINALTASSRRARALHMNSDALFEKSNEAPTAELRLAALEVWQAANREFAALGSRSLRRERATSLLALRRASKLEAGRQWTAARLPAAA